MHRGSQDLVLDHYLEVLARKPGALPGSTTLAQARQRGVFTQAHDRFWAAARRGLGDGAGTRALIEVLLLHRRLPAEYVLAGIDATLGVGSTNPALVAIEARRLADAPPAEAAPITRVVGPDERPAPALTGYDVLLDQPLAAVTELGARR